MLCVCAYEKMFIFNECIWKNLRLRDMVRAMSTTNELNVV